MTTEEDGGGGGEERRERLEKGGSASSACRLRSLPHSSTVNASLAQSTLIPSQQLPSLLLLHSLSISQFSSPPNFIIIMNYGDDPNPTAQLMQLNPK